MCRTRKAPAAWRDARARILALRAWGSARLRSPTARWAVNILALAGAALIVVSAIIHLYLWDQGYRGIAVIGPLFLAQGVISIPFAVVLGVFRRLVLPAAGLARARHPHLSAGRPGRDAVSPSGRSG